MGLLTLADRLLRMTVFAYSAIEAATGRKTAGRLQSAGQEEAIAELRTRGLCPTRVVAIDSKGAMAGGQVGAKPPLAAARKPACLGKAVGRKERMIFTRQLAALVGAGMPLVRALDLLARQEKDPEWREVIAGLAEAISSGGTLARGMTNHPGIFDRLYVGMVTAGESGGRLEVVLERLARHLENSGRIESRVRAAMTYPIVVMAVAAAIVTALMTFVVPRFEKIFLTMLKGAPLPRLTSGVLGASRFVQNNWWWLLGAAALAWAGARWMLKREACARAFDRLILRSPMIGDLVLKTAVARFSRTLGTMLTSGVPMLQALHLARDSCGNRHLAESIDDVRRRVREGESVARPLEASGVFPVVVAGMVEVGEETGTLPAMLHHIADMYDGEVEHGVTSLTSLIEPLMIVFMAVVVGAIVIALFLPIVRIIQLMTQ